MPHSESLESVKISSARVSGKNERPSHFTSWFSQNNRLRIAGFVSITVDFHDFNFDRAEFLSPKKRRSIRLTGRRASEIN
ncbi:hypothetical protein AYI69_g1535 [Smittium culicis]|uniref:Uncharacterized protein n=1 Tax=Smittium culicis TaxID=133412 RepID=A0A1R1YQD4_9FUNG|nr:hypothetical protein AYI69_g1535 [Smittium culicis]